MSRDAREPEEQAAALNAVKSTILEIVIIVVVGYELQKRFCTFDFRVDMCRMPYALLFGYFLFIVLYYVSQDFRKNYVFLIDSICYFIHTYITMPRKLIISFLYVWRLLSCKSSLQSRENTNLTDCLVDLYKSLMSLPLILFSIYF